MAHPMKGDHHSPPPSPPFNGAAFTACLRDGGVCVLCVVLTLNCGWRVVSFASCVCRLAKEEVMYIKEVQQQEERIERLKVEDKDLCPHVLSKQVHRCWGWDVRDLGMHVIMLKSYN